MGRDASRRSSAPAHRRHGNAFASRRELQLGGASDRSALRRWAHARRESVVREHGVPLGLIVVNPVETLAVRRALDLAWPFLNQPDVVKPAGRMAFAFIADLA